MEGNGDVVEYPGGYKDYIRQRKNRIDGPKKQAEKKKKEKKEAPSSSKSQSKKLSYKHQFALDNMPKEIARIEKNIKMFEEKLAEPNLYSENPDLFHKCSVELEKLTVKREQKEEEWLELEILREETEE
jgi:ATP-binding cassette subfamily F protein uup